MTINISPPRFTSIFAYTCSFVATFTRYVAHIFTILTKEIVVTFWQKRFSLMYYSRFSNIEFLLVLIYNFHLEYSWDLDSHCHTHSYRFHQCDDIVLTPRNFHMLNYNYLRTFRHHKLITKIWINHLSVFLFVNK